MRCVLVGNYGVDNLGDEALRAYFLNSFPDIEWQVVTPDGEYPRLPMGLRSLFGPWWKTLKAIRLCDALVYGGGSLFTDAESWRAPFLWWWYAFFAGRYRKPVVMAFQGVGPARSFIAKRCTGSVLLRSTFISVRDPGSLKRVEGFLGETGLKNKTLVQTFDPALAIFKGSSQKSTKKLIIIPRANTTPKFLERVRSKVAKGWDEVVMLLLEPGADQHAAQQVQESVKNIPVRTVDIRSFGTLAAEVSSAQFVLTQRYHGAVAALANDVVFEAVPQAPGDKLDAVNGADSQHCLGLLKVGEESLEQFFQNISRSPDVAPAHR